MTDTRLDVGDFARGVASDRKTVFLAEDDSAALDRLAEVLDETGRYLVVGGCGDGLKLLAQAQISQADIILINVGIPGFLGIDACFELKRLLPNSAVLIYSAADTDQAIIQALDKGEAF